MTTLYDSEFQSILYNEAKNIIGNVWKPNTAKINDRGFKEEILTFGKFIAEKKPKGILGNTQQLNFAIPPAFQDWIVDNYFATVLESGVQKYAIIVSTDLITQLSVEQTIEEEKSSGFVTRYFDNDAEALEWLSI